MGIREWIIRKSIEMLPGVESTRFYKSGDFNSCAVTLQCHPEYSAEFAKGVKKRVETLQTSFPLYLFMPEFRLEIFEEAETYRS